MENYRFSINFNQTLYIYEGIKIVFTNNEDYHYLKVKIIDNGKVRKFERCFPVFKRKLIILLYGECRDDCDELSMSCIANIYSLRGRQLLNDFQFPSNSRNVVRFQGLDEYKKNVSSIIRKLNIPQCVINHIFTFITEFYM